MLCHVEMEQDPPAKDRERVAGWDPVGAARDAARVADRDKDSGPDFARRRGRLRTDQTEPIGGSCYCCF